MSARKIPPRLEVHWQYVGCGQSSVTHMRSTSTGSIRRLEPAEAEKVFREILKYGGVRFIEPLRFVEVP